MRSLRQLSYYIQFAAGRALRPALCLLLLAGFVSADPVGRVRGTVKTPDGTALENVKILIVATGEKPRQYTATTNAKGEYVHIGIKPDDYRITPSLEGYMPVEYGYVDLHISPSDRPVEVDFKMQKAAAAQKEQQAPSVGEGEKGVQLLSEGKFDEAIAVFQKALETDATNAGIHYNLAVAFERKDMMAEARKHFEAAIQSKSDFGEAYLALGNSYMREQNFDSAVPYLEKASGLMPANYNAAYNLGASLSNTGKYSEAEAAFRKAVQASPNEPVAHYQLGMALLGQSKNAEARAEFQKYLELNPNAADRGEVEELLKTLQ